MASFEVKTGWNETLSWSIGAPTELEDPEICKKNMRQKKKKKKFKAPNAFLEHQTHSKIKNEGIRKNCKAQAKINGQVHADKVDSVTKIILRTHTRITIVHFMKSQVNFLKGRRD